MQTFTTDPNLNKNLIVHQPESGYRFSADSLLLADHVQPEEGETILDIGCGCGIIALILASKFNCTRIIGVEIQEELARFAKENARVNGFETSLSIVKQDIRTVYPSDLGGQVDRIITNPPYKKKSSGRLNPNLQKAVARHEIQLTLKELADSVKRLLAPSGVFHIIYPAERTVDLLSAMKGCGIEPAFLRFIHTKEKDNAKRIIMTANKTLSKPVTILPPLYHTQCPVKKPLP